MYIWKSAECWNVNCIKQTGYIVPCGLHYKMMSSISSDQHSSRKWQPIELKPSEVYPCWDSSSVLVFLFLLFHFDFYSKLESGRGETTAWWQFLFCTRRRRPWSWALIYELMEMPSRGNHWEVNQNSLSIILLTPKQISTLQNIYLLTYLTQSSLSFFFWFLVSVWKLSHLFNECFCLFEFFYIYV